MDDNSERVGGNHRDAKRWISSLIFHIVNIYKHCETSHCRLIVTRTGGSSPMGSASRNIIRDKTARAIIINYLHPTCITNPFSPSSLLPRPATPAQTPPQKMMTASSIPTSTPRSPSSPKPSPPKPRAPSAETTPKKGSAPTTRSASSLTAPNSSASIWRQIAHTRRKVATPSRRKGTAATGSAATSSTSGWCARTGDKNGEQYTQTTDGWWRGGRWGRCRGCWNCWERERHRFDIYIVMLEYSAYNIENRSLVTNPCGALHDHAMEKWWGQANCRRCSILYNLINLL